MFSLFICYKKVPISEIHICLTASSLSLVHKADYCQLRARTWKPSSVLTPSCKKVYQANTSIWPRSEPVRRRLQGISGNSFSSDYTRDFVSIFFLALSEMIFLFIVVAHSSSELAGTNTCWIFYYITVSKGFQSLLTLPVTSLEPL